MNIDQALIALCRKHDLHSVQISIMESDNRSNGYCFTAFAHWLQAGVQYCRHSTKATASEAIAHAIQQVNEARACVVDVPAMELECGA